MEMKLKIRNIKILRKIIYLLLTGGDVIEDVVTEGNAVERENIVVIGVVNVVVVVVIVVAGRVGITIGTIIPVRIRLTTVFINGYRP
jgi:hypothetical protein